jgi:hypothetical protein
MKRIPLFSFVVSMLFAANSLAVQYSLIELGPFTGAVYINDNGQIAANGNWKAGTWSADSGFKALAQERSYAYAINNNGLTADS